MIQLSHDQIVAVLLALPDGVLDDVHGLTPSHRDAISAIHARQPEKLSLLAVLATTGCQTARKSATTRFSTEINNHIENTRLAKMYQDGVDDDYDPYSMPPNTTLALNELRFYWNFHNVAQEFGDPDSDQTLHTHGSMIGSLLPALRTEQGYAYWRGASALYLSTDEDWDSVDLSSSEEFILWAGQHGSIKDVIDTVRDRKTTDVGTLSYLVGGNNSHGAISRGTL